MRNKLKKWSIIMLLISFLGFNWQINNNGELVNLTAKAAIQSSFPDVKSDNLHITAIEFLKAKGIISGYPDGNFQPDKTINRAEALKLVFLAREKLIGNQTYIDKNINFPDVKSSDWFYDYVKKAFSTAVVEGYSDGTFKPENQITAVESLKIILLTLVKDYQNSPATTDPFLDIKKDQWSAGYALYAKNRQLIEASGNNGVADGGFGPDRKLSRAEFVEILYRTFYSEENKLEKFPLSINWKACNNYQLNYKLKYPNSWKKVLAGDQMIFWREDSSNSQVSFARVYPNSAVVIVAVDKNPQKLDLQKYLDTLEYGQGSNKQVITLNDLPYASIFVEQSGLQDSYFKMPNGEILVIYAQVGNGNLSTALKEEIRYLVGSVRQSSTASSDKEENCMETSNSGGATAGVEATANELILSQIMQKVLILGMSQSALDKLDDEIIISTDTIGIGTGPIDYYYSAKLDLTLKIERNSKTILASKKGKSSAF